MKLTALQFSDPFDFFLHPSSFDLSYEKGRLLTILYFNFCKTSG